MTLGTDNVQAASLKNLIMALGPFRLDPGNLLFRGVLHGRDFVLPVTAEYDIGTTTGHVGGDGDCARPARLGNDMSFGFVLLGVQDLVFDPRLLEQHRKKLGSLDRRGTHEDRAPFGGDILDLINDRVEFLFLSQIHQIVVVSPLNRLVGRNDHHVEAVDLTEFESFGVCGTGHAGQLVVKPEIILERRGRESLTFGLDLDAFFGLNRLMQAFAPAAPRHGTAGMLVHDDHLAALNNVIHVFLEQMVGPQCRVHVVQQAEVGR